MHVIRPVHNLLAFIYRSQEGIILCTTGIRNEEDIKFNKINLVLPFEQPFLAILLRCTDEVVLGNVITFQLVLEF